MSIESQWTVHNNIDYMLVCFIKSQPPGKGKTFTLKTLSMMDVCKEVLVILIYINSIYATSRSGVTVKSYAEKVHASGAVFYQFTAVSKTECGGACIADLRCISFNLNTDGLCSLMGEILEDGELEDDQNNDFYGETL